MFLNDLIELGEMVILKLQIRRNSQSYYKIYYEYIRIYKRQETLTSNFDVIISRFVWYSRFNLCKKKNKKKSENAYELCARSCLTQKRKLREERMWRNLFTRRRVYQQGISNPT